MRAKKALPGSIFLTASQSLQGLRSEMRMAEHAKREAGFSDLNRELDGKALQQAPFADERNAAPRHSKTNISEAKLA